MTNILLIEPSSAGLELLIAAKKMNLSTVVFSANRDERIIPVCYREYIDHMLEIDTYDIPLIFSAAKKINEKYFLSAVIPGSEYHVPIASQIAELLCLPGVSPAHVDGLRIKSQTRKTLKENNVRIPRYTVISVEDDLLNAEKYVGFPCVLKPVAAAGSMHVSRADNKRELLQAYRSMRNDTWSELGKGLGVDALVEEYIEGEEFSVEGYIDGANIKPLSITKKFLSKEPLFIEMGHIVPANIGEAMQITIEKYLQDVIKALNIHIGVFHAELRIDKDGPVLMEIAGRLPGCRICDLIQMSNGINMYEIMILSHLGRPIDIHKNDTIKFAGMCYFSLDGKESFNQVMGLEQLRELSGFCEFRLLRKPGEYVPPLTTFLGRIATCIFTGPNYSELKLSLEKAVSLISFS